MPIKIHRGSGNVFTDLGFDADEAALLHLRSDLMIKLRLRLQTLGKTQAEWAKILKVSQPRVSDLFGDKFDRFSIDMLIKFLAKTGAEVRVTVRNKRRAA